MAEASGWERIYRERGDLGLGLQPKIVKAVDIFRERGYKKILDLACGTGKHSLYLAGKGFEVTATDMAFTGIAIARAKAEAAGIGHIIFREHDMRHIPFEDGSFDVVICIWSLHHGTVAEIQKTIDEMYRVLRTGGMVITDLPSVKTESYGIGKEIERDTFLGEKENEEDVPHHYTTPKEIRRFFSRFSRLEYRLSTRRYKDEAGCGHFSKRYHIKAVRQAF